MTKKPWQNRIISFVVVEREKMVNYVRRLIDDTAERDSEDVVQDVMLNLLRRSDLTIPVENLAGYIYQALRNRVIDYMRKRKDIISLSEGIFGEDEISLGDILPDLMTERNDEAAKVEIKETLFKMLSVLKEEERTVLIATELEGRKFQELSDEWGVPLGTLLARKSRAINKLKDIQKDEKEGKERENGRSLF